jgi:hypothetical protein
VNSKPEELFYDPVRIVAFERVGRDDRIEAAFLDHPRPPSWGPLLSDPGFLGLELVSLDRVKHPLVRLHVDALVALEVDLDR